MNSKGKCVCGGELDWEAEDQHGGVTTLSNEASVKEEAWPLHRDGMISEAMTVVWVVEDLEGKRRGWARRKRRSASPSKV